MTTEELKARTLEGFERMFNQGDLAYVDNGLAPGAVDHQEPDGTDLGAHLKNVISTLRTAFPDIKITDESITAEGDRVSIRWSFEGTHSGEFFGMPGSGKKVGMGGFDIFRVKDGRIQELWLENDYMTLLQQLGMIPSAEEAPATA